MVANGMSAMTISPLLSAKTQSRDASKSPSPVVISSSCAPSFDCGATVFVQDSSATIASEIAEADQGSHVVKISINPRRSQGRLVSTVRLNPSDQEDPVMTSAKQRREQCFYFQNGAPLASGQCSPSDTLDSGTCSDLDGTPPPLPKKKLPTLGQGQHNRTGSLTSSGAEVDSDDDESNVSYDSLNNTDVWRTLGQSEEDKNEEFKNIGLNEQLSHVDDCKSKYTVFSNWNAAASGQPMLIKECTYEERNQPKMNRIEEQPTSNGKYVYEDDKFYKFHLNECRHEAGDKPAEKDEDECFAGYKMLERDAIRSAKGTVRGVKNRVRAGIATFLQKPSVKDYRAKDAGKVVVYTTTMGIVRETYYACTKVKQILRTHLVKYEERDLYMSAEFQAELKERIDCAVIDIPQLFIDGQLIGDANTVERLNESGKLRLMLKPYQSSMAFNTCAYCGGYRLFPCPVCNGSKKSVHRNDFTAEFVALKCMNCDEVGLVRCNYC